MNASGESIDLYEVLGLQKTASKAEIKKAYHKVGHNAIADQIILPSLGGDFG